MGSGCEPSWCRRRMGIMCSGFPAMTPRPSLSAAMKRRATACKTHGSRPGLLRASGGRKPTSRAHPCFLSAAGAMLLPCDGIDLTPGIYQQTSNTSAVESTDATFSVLVTNRAAVNYQWRLNGSNLGGANASKLFYTLSNVSLSVNSGQVYSCLVSNSAGAVTSAPITLTVVRD